MKIQLKGREIPRNEAGDPAFVELGVWKDSVDKGIQAKDCVLQVFTPQEVVALVNRALYQLEYQHTAHKERGKRVRAEEKAIRLKVKELFHVSWMKATPEQIEKAKREVEKA